MPHAAPGRPGKNDRAVYTCLTMMAQFAGQAERAGAIAMRIETRQVSGSSGGQAAGRAQAAGARFVLPDAGESVRAGATMQAGALASLDAMLALQGAEQAHERRKRAARRGHVLLDSLDSLKISLLSGKASAATLRNLADALKQDDSAGDDPRLDAIIGEIELRAAVELAKLDQK